MTTETTKPTVTYIWGTGRRKTATARVRIKPGQGVVTVNRIPMEKYFTTVRCRNAVLSPLKFTKLETNFDVLVNVVGGGMTGQAEAVRMGLSRALLSYDSGLEKALRDEGYLTRDDRMVERKKYGQPGARKRFQYSKR